MGQTFSVGLFDFRLGSLKNGLDVVETMQALGCKSVYVMVSADVESSTQLRAINLKLFEFMRKPVAPEDLLETVQPRPRPIAADGGLITGPGRRPRLAAVEKARIAKRRGINTWAFAHDHLCHKLSRSRPQAKAMA